MRVAQIISGDLWAGAEVMAFNLVRELIRHPGLSLSVLLLNDGVLATKLKELPVELKVFEESRHTFLQLLSASRQWLHHLQPQVIHSHRYKEHILAYLASRGMRGPRLIATQHSLPEAGQSARFSLKWFVGSLSQTLLRHRFNRVVGVSANVADYFSSVCRMPVTRLEVIHNGISLPDTIPHLVQKDRLVVGSAGRLYPVKDYPLMVQVARSLTQDTPAARFLLAGEGPERPLLEKLVRGYSLENNFSLVGHQHDISTFYASINVYINTSRHEGIPMSILEAMAYGLPVVAPDVGGIGEIIDHGVNGFLVAGRTPEDFAGPIRLLQNEGLRHRVGEAAREKIRKAFSAEAMAEQYFQLYRSSCL